RRQLPCPVNHRQDLDAILPNSVDDSIGVLQQLADRRVLVFGHLGAELRMVLQLLRPSRDAIHYPPGVPGRILGNVIVEGAQLPPGVVRPEDSHSGSPKERRTSSTVSTRPASASRRPASIDCRT